MAKDSIQQEYISMLIYMHQKEEHLDSRSKFLKTYKGNLDSQTIKVGDFNTPLTLIRQIIEVEN